MKSRLNFTEFNSRLKKSTTSEIDFYFISSYKISGELFCGEFTDSTFDLTKNSHWRHIKAIQIKGQYKKSADFTDVTYSVGLSKFLRNFSIAFFCVITIALNVFLLNQSNSSISIYLTLNGFLLFGVLWTFIVILLSSKIVESRFKEVFEIADQPLTTP